MSDFLMVTGVVIKQMPVGESDRRVTILTTTHGKITAFARGARKPNSRFAASTCPFCFGDFKLYPGRDSYTLQDAAIKNYFEGLRLDFEAAGYAGYFGEIADYYCVENNDEKQMLKLLYQGLNALLSEAFDNSLVRAVFELKAIEVNGEFPGVPQDMNLSETAQYTLQYIAASPPEKVFSFQLSKEVLEELKKVADIYCKRYRNHHFKSLEILDSLC